MMRVSGAQQVMLEVKVAEISKSLLDQLGVEANLTRAIGGTSVNLLSQLLSTGSSTITLARPNGATTITLNAEMKKGLAKVLAEPTITAINGQEGSFLAGGKIFIPVPRADPAGGTVITLVEKEFGVGLRFLPTVLTQKVLLTMGVKLKDVSEKMFLQQKLTENDWNVKRTAEALGMQRSHLYKKIERYGLK